LVTRAHPPGGGTKTASRQPQAPRATRTGGESPSGSAKSARVNGSLVENIVERVRDRIRDGRLAPGQRLVEADMQRLFEASRGSIREAVRRLAAEGLVELRHNSGAIVRALAPEEVANVFRIREALEALAARLAAENVRRGANPGELLELEARFHRNFDGSAVGYMRYNDAFHDLVVRLSGNEQLIQLVRQLHVRVYRLQVEALRSSASYIDSRREHGAIVRAIAKGDGATAERLMRRHIRRRLPEILGDSSEFFA
jgi:DNA-binding GntR family transcriptional regulator